MGVREYVGQLGGTEIMCKSAFALMCVPSTNTTSGDRYPARATSSSTQRNMPSIISAVKRWQKA